ncbi:MAG TPA: hypothetical protein VL475_01385 [Planctomycetaceae bacterium]|nr:hypothetical protein [Planctomycetaceae bacterium]
MSTRPPFDPSSKSLSPGIDDGSGIEANHAELAAGGARKNEFAILEQRGRSGANWFYWIAALSLVNSVIQLSGGDRHFVIGLAVTSIVDAVGAGLAQGAPDVATVIKVVAFGVTLVIAGFVALFGWLAGRRSTAAFAIGMGLYVCDGLLYTLAQEWMSVGFHAFALYGMWNGLAAFRQLRAMEESQAWEQAPA